MRTFAYILILAGLLLLTIAGCDEHRGATREPSYRNPVASEIQRDDRPELFRRAMIFHWSFAGLILFAGITLRQMVRKRERLDPLSPDFDWQEETPEK